MLTMMVRVRSETTIEKEHHVFRFFENLIHPYNPQEPVIPPKSFWGFVWAGTKGLRPYILTMTLLTASIGAFEAFLFSMLGSIVDRLSHVEPTQLWAEQKIMLMGMVGVLLLSIGAVALQTIIKHQALAGNFPMRLRWNFHRLLLSQSMSFFQDEFSGRVTAKVLQTALAVRDTVFTLGDILVFVIIYFVTMTAVAGGFNRWLLIPFLLWLICYVLAVLFFVPRLARAGQKQADARSIMTGRVTDAYTNIATVKLFSHTKREAAYAQQAMQDFMKTVNGQMRLVSAFEITNHTLSIGLVIMSTGVALWLWTQGQVGIGALAASTAMALRLNGLSHWVMWEMAGLFENIGTVQDGMNMLSRPHQVVDIDSAAKLKVSQGEIQFENVDFAYQADRPVISQLNLTIKPGEKIGLVGRSGAGKSTLVNLLLRFYDVSGGRILIDGQDIAQVTQDSLRQQIGMVTQDTSLLHRSVRENILYGRPDATDEQMNLAAQRAEADTFIRDLTDPAGRRGFDAQVGERGVKLSGGQRQRIAIARVMLKDAPILLLDEATSALDSEVEAAIQASLNTLMEGKTVVAIAHRLSTIAAMDRLIVLEHGRIVEEGDHATLLAHGGIYARLWARQSGGFLGEESESIYPAS